MVLHVFDQQRELARQANCRLEAAFAELNGTYTAYVQERCLRDACAQHLLVAKVSELPVIRAPEVSRSRS